MYRYLVLTMLTVLLATLGCTQTPAEKPGSIPGTAAYFPPPERDGGWRVNTEPEFVRSLGLDPRTRLRNSAATIWRSPPATGNRTPTTAALSSSRMAG